MMLYLFHKGELREVKEGNLPDPSLQTYNMIAYSTWSGHWYRVIMNLFEFQWAYVAASTIPKPIRLQVALLTGQL